MSSQYGELRPTNGLTSLGHPCKFQLVSRLGSITARRLVVGVSQTCGVEQRALPTFGRATITLCIGPHFKFPKERLVAMFTLAVLQHYLQTEGK